MHVVHFIGQAPYMVPGGQFAKQLRVFNLVQEILDAISVKGCSKLSLLAREGGTFTYMGLAAGGRDSPLRDIHFLFTCFGYIAL